MEEYKVISARVYCAGIRVKCRKAEKHKFKLEFDEESVTQLALSTVRKNMRSLLSDQPILLALSEDKIQNRPDGIHIRSFSIGKGHRTVDITERWGAPA